MFSDCFAADLCWRHFFNTSPKYPFINQKKIHGTAFRVFGVGLFFLVVFLSAQAASAADVTLAWDPNKESDLEGYGVYFQKGTDGPPYNLAGNITTDELTDPNNPTFTVTGLVKGARYYFALKAYDTAGNESAYSTSVCADIGDVIAPCSNTVVGGGGGSSSGGGGGGGGCFIETASADAVCFNPWLVVPTAFGCMVAGFIFRAKGRSRRLLPFLARNALKIRPVNKAGRGVLI